MEPFSKKKVHQWHREAPLFLRVLLNKKNAFLKKQNILLTPGFLNVNVRNKIYEIICIVCKYKQYLCMHIIFHRLIRIFWGSIFDNRTHVRDPQYTSAENSPLRGYCVLGSEQITERDSKIEWKKEKREVETETQSPLETYCCNP